MMDHTFLSPHGRILLPGQQLKNLALTWSFVADNAIRSVRYDYVHEDWSDAIVIIRISHPTNLTSHDLMQQGEW